AESMWSSVAEDCQTHGDGDGQDSGSEDRYRRRSKQDGPKTSGRGQDEVTKRGSHGEKHDDTATGTGSICDVSPEGLHDDAHERKWSQDPAQFRSRQPGVFVEIKAVVWRSEEHTSEL